MRASDVFVSAQGGTIEWLSEDGEVLASVPVPAGFVSARDYLGFAPDADQIQLSPGLSLVSRPRFSGIQKYGVGSHYSGANPDFRPASATRLEREMRLTLSRMQQATSRVEARERQLAKVQRAVKPAEPAVGDSAVIEPDVVRQAPAQEAADDGAAGSGVVA